MDLWGFPCQEPSEDVLHILPIRPDSLTAEQKVVGHCDYEWKKTHHSHPDVKALCHLK